MRFPSFRALSRLHHMDHVVTVLAFAPQESQVSQGALDPRDQQVFRDHPALKDPRDHEETKVTPANKEAKDQEAQQVHEVPRAIQARKEAKALQVPRDPKGHWELTGNSACLKI